MSAPALPTESDHFKVRYKTWVGALCLLLGIAATLLSLRTMLTSNRFSSSVIFGILAMIVGYLFLTRSYFVIAPNRLTVYGLLGKAVKRYPFAAFSDIKTENGKVYIDSDAAAGSSRESVSLINWLIHPDDWETLKAISSFRS